MARGTRPQGLRLGAAYSAGICPPRRTPTELHFAGPVDPSTRWNRIVAQAKTRLRQIFINLVANAIKFTAVVFVEKIETVGETLFNVEVIEIVEGNDCREGACDYLRVAGFQVADLSELDYLRLPGVVMTTGVMRIKTYIDIRGVGNL